MELLTLWLLAAMVHWQPPANADDVLRYTSIASDLSAVVLDPAEVPLFRGQHARAETAILLLSIAFFESGGFAKSVDEGKRRGDGGQSWCLMQIRIGPWRTAEGWSGEDLAADRKKCFRAALTRLRISLTACERLKFPDRLGGYVRGACRPDDRVSRHRVWWARTYWKEHKSEIEAL